MQPRLQLTIDNHIATVTLTHAEKHNALDMPMFYAIDQVIKTIRQNNTIQAVILTADGEDFCTGLDVKAIMKSPKNSVKLLFKWWPTQANLAQRVSTAWRSLPVPVIAAIHGRCWGGGLQIALGADIRFACKDSNWSIMENRWGLIPDMGGTLAFKELMHIDIATELAMSARQINGEQAKTYGLVTHLAENPLSAAQQLAEELIQNSPDANAAIKKLIQKSWWSTSAMTLLRESYYQLKILLGKNQRIAVHRRLNKGANLEEQKKDFLPRKFK
ncbi:MAG: enoyl-CoA hydratase [Gammaproteobacteria bacterium]|nr:MAG: enoyl-CoA hydratase [Gammaproteobacteria bacterium]